MSRNTRYRRPFAGRLRSASIDRLTGTMTGRTDGRGAGESVCSPLIVAIQDDQMTPTIRNPDV